MIDFSYFFKDADNKFPPEKMRREIHNCANSGSPSGFGVCVSFGLLALSLGSPSLGSTVLTTSERAELAHNRFLDSRRTIMAIRENPYSGPAVAQVVEERPKPWKVHSNPWHYQIRATVFWVGEKPTARNPVPNAASSWDQNWEANFGGYDHPFKRSPHGFRPAAFEPKLNPFYVALPYNDLLKGRVHRPEASGVIPWFWRRYRGAGVSVCEDRWIAIHHQGLLAYAQWKDVGPFTIDDWPYVFQGERPRPNSNQNAGIDVSPAVRDFLHLKGNAVLDWRFVEDLEVPRGPWSKWVRPPINSQNGRAP